MVPTSTGAALGFTAVAFLVVQEAQRFWQAATGAVVAAPAAAAAVEASTPTPAQAGILEQARTALFYIGVGLLLGVITVGWLWIRVGRFNRSEVNLSVGTSVTVNPSHAATTDHRRRRGGGVLEGPEARASSSMLVHR